MILLGLFQDPPVYLAVIGAFIVAAGVLAFVPIRGGTGQHAGAGPGAVMVWQLSEALEAERNVRLASPRIPTVSIETVEEPPPEDVIRWPEEEIRWPAEPVAEYVGRHRLRWDIDEHPPCLVDIQLGPGFPDHEVVSLLGSRSNPRDSWALSGGTGR